MTFGENNFLIEAYAISMTDKLTIVKKFGCGASQSASVLCEHSSGVGFFSDYVHLEMFTQHSASSSETATKAPSDNLKLQKS